MLDDFDTIWICYDVIYYWKVVQKTCDFSSTKFEHTFFFRTWNFISSLNLRTKDSVLGILSILEDPQWSSPRQAWVKKKQRTWWNWLVTFFWWDKKSIRIQQRYTVGWFRNPAHQIEVGSEHPIIYQGFLQTSPGGSGYLNHQQYQQHQGRIEGQSSWKVKHFFYIHTAPEISNSWIVWP